MVTVSKELQQTLQAAVAEARRRRHEYVTLEHLLHAMTRDKVASEVLLACGADLEAARARARGVPGPHARVPRHLAGSRADGRLPAGPAAGRLARAGLGPHRAQRRRRARRHHARARLARRLPAREAGRPPARHPPVHLARHRQGGRRGRRAAGGRGRGGGRSEDGEGPVQDVHREPARARRAGAHRSRSSAATPRSSGRSRSSAAAGRTTRCSSASPASARRPSWRGSRSASTRRRSRRSSRRPRSTRSTWARSSPAPSSAASSSSG